jgi:hypothetical protein
MREFAASDVGRVNAMTARPAPRPAQLPSAFRYVSTDVPVGMTLAAYRRRRGPRRVPWWRRLWTRRS